MWRSTLLPELAGPKLLQVQIAQNRKHVRYAIDAGVQCKILPAVSALCSAGTGIAVSATYIC